MQQTLPPGLRGDIKVSKLVQQGVMSYVIKEPDKQEYYHFEEAQYQMMALFNGVRDFERLVFEFNRRSDLYEYDIEDVEELYNTCREFQLLERSKSEQNAALLEKIREERKKKVLQGQGSILFLRFQLVNPNKFFDQVIDKLRFFWHPSVVKVQAMFILSAIILVLFQGERLADDFNRVYLQTHLNDFGLLGIWLIALSAIAVHECGHGLTCKHFGGEVHEMGFLLLAFQPCLYCNVNDAWLFESKWQKIYVALAGVWVEMLLAALGAYIWLFVDVGNSLGYICFVLMTIGTATSLLVNLNPLLKFDGYYILTDILEMQNLRQNSIAWFSYSLKTKILRMEVEAPLSPTKRERNIYLLYGALVTIYMIAILSFIAILGYGLVSAHFGFLANLAFIYLVFFLVKKITGSWGETMVAWSKEVFWSSKQRKHTTIAGLVGCLLVLIFWSPRVSVISNGIVEAPIHIVYAPENGFVERLSYNINREIKSPVNEPFMVLSSPELEVEKAQLLSSSNMLQLQQQEASASNEQATGRRLLIERGLIDEQLQSINDKLKSLVLFRPQGNWLVDGMPPKLMQGRFFASGSPIVTLVDKQQRFIDVVVDQRDLYLLKVGDHGRIRFAGVAPQIYNATIERISAVAKLEGIEQSLQVRMSIELESGMQVPPLGLSGEIKIFGEPLPLWRHFLHSIRKILRADLWL